MSLVIDIADAVAAELNAAVNGTFSQPFVAQRRVLPEFSLEELAELKVTVVPKAVEITGSTRSASQYDITIDIGVQQKLPPASSNNEDIDAQVATLGALVDEIADYLRRRPLSLFSGTPLITWVSTTNEPVYASEHLAEQRVFTSVLTVTYRGMK